jgi:hypothetical protein
MSREKIEEGLWKRRRAVRPHKRTASGSGCFWFVRCRKMIGWRSG